MSQRTDTASMLVETVRAACLDAALKAYEDAGIRGLCTEGRWEAALAAIRHLDLSDVLAPAVYPRMPECLAVDGRGTGVRAEVPAAADRRHVYRARLRCHQDRHCRSLLLGIQHDRSTSSSVCSPLTALIA